MTKKNKRDKLLLENLERILKGNDIENSASLDDQTRAALDVARKMMTLREKPAKEYADNLKAQLVYQLSEQEKKEDSKKQGFWSWQFPRVTAWQATVSAVVLVVVLACILLVVNNIQPGSHSEETASSTTVVTGTTITPSTSIPTDAPSSPATSPSEIKNLTVLTVVDKPIYTVGQQVNIKIVIENESKLPLVLDRFPPAINIKNISSGEIITLGIEGTTQITIQPGGAKIVTIDWETQSVTATGNYAIEVGKIYSVEVPLKITFTEPVQFVLISQ